MMFKLQSRDHSGDVWRDTCNPNGVYKWYNPYDALKAFQACVKPWGLLAHRMIRCDSEGEPLEVVALIDLDRLYEWRMKI